MPSLYVNTVDFGTVADNVNGEDFEASGHLPPWRILRAALLVAARALLDEGGVAAVSLREVARRAGVTPAACYRDSLDKEALLTALADASRSSRKPGPSCQGERGRRSPRWAWLTSSSPSSG